MDLTCKALANKIKGVSRLLKSAEKITQMLTTGKSCEELRDTFNFGELTATLEEEV